VARAPSLNVVNANIETTLQSPTACLDVALERVPAQCHRLEAKIGRCENLIEHRADSEGFQCSVRLVASGTCLGESPERPGRFAKLSQPLEFVGELLLYETRLRSFGEGAWRRLDYRLRAHRVTLCDIYETSGMPAILAMGNRTEAPGCLVEQAANAALGTAFDEAEAPASAPRR
jgi:hypothetical protein